MANELATFAGGCFWCMVKPFDEQEGIVSVISGYTGGKVPNPTYEEVCSGMTGHTEAVQITFDPTVFPYENLLSVFWQLIDPTDAGGQFYDRGSSYRPAIFYHNDKQKQLAEESKSALQSSGRFKAPIVVEIVPADTFYPAEEYHQHYYQKNLAHYNAYYEGSGRAGFIKKHWGHNDIKKKLNRIQYEVTQNNATEPPFQNEYWNQFEEGIYVDIVSGKPLFSSLDKFDAGCGWPSFTKPIEENEIIEKVDQSYGMIRTEVRSKTANSHLGHVFDDGPGETKLRYCINSASLKFIPISELEKEGYAKYLKLFYQF